MRLEALVEPGERVLVAALGERRVADVHADAGTAVEVARRVQVSRCGAGAAARPPRTPAPAIALHRQRERRGRASSCARSANSTASSLSAGPARSAAPCLRERQVAQAGGDPAASSQARKRSGWPAGRRGGAVGAPSVGQSRAVEQRLGRARSEAPGARSRAASIQARPSSQRLVVPPVVAKLAEQLQGELGAARARAPRTAPPARWGARRRAWPARRSVGPHEMGRCLAREVQAPAGEPLVGRRRASGSSASRSSAYSRTVSSMSRRSSRRTSSCLATSESRVSSEAPVTVSAAPPWRRRRRRPCARTPALLVGEQAVAPVDGRAQGALALRGVARTADEHASARSRRAASSGAESSPMRAAASSSASGSPSSRRQISHTCGALASSRVKSGSRARARSQNMATAP